MALAKIDKTKIVVSDAGMEFGALGYKELDSLKKGANMVTVVKNGYKLGKITDSSATGYVKVQLLNEIYGPKAEDTWTVLYFKRSELSYETSYTKTVKTSTSATPAAIDLTNYWVTVSATGVLNVRDKPSKSGKLLRKLTNNQLVGKSDGVTIMGGTTEFYRFVNSKGAVYYVGSEYVTSTKPTATEVTTTDKKDKPIVISPEIEPDVKPIEALDSPNYQSDNAMQTVYYVIGVLMVAVIIYFLLKPKKPTQNANNSTK